MFSKEPVLHNVESNLNRCACHTREIYSFPMKFQTLQTNTTQKDERSSKLLLTLYGVSVIVLI